jgi:PAS domain S-box-containing protein
MRRDWIRITSSESHLTTTLRSIAEGVILTDVEGHITLLNGAAEGLTGWREEEAKGKHFRDVVRLVDRETHKPLEPLTEEVVRSDSGKVRMGAVVLVARDGTERIVQQSASAISGRRGVAGVALVCRDVTERELGDAAFRASQETFRLITENMSDVVTLHDVHGRVLFQSNPKHNTTLFPKVAGDAEPFSHVVKEDRPTVHEAFERLIETGQPQRLEYRLQHPGDGIIFVESMGTLVRRSDGTPDRIVAVSRDVSKRREIERRLIAEKEFTDTLLASLPGIFFVCDPEGYLLKWNHNFEIVVGRTSAEIAELQLTAYFPLQEQHHV